MAKKKKKKGNAKKHYSGGKKKYSLRVLNEIVKTTTSRIEAGEEVSEYDKKLLSAANKTVELMSEFGHSKLDLSRDSESYLDEVLARKGIAMQEDGADEEQIIKTLCEAGASYLLFEQINLLTSFGVVGDVYYNGEESENLMIKAHMFMNPNNVFFDPYITMEEVSGKCFIFHDVKPAEMGVEDANPDDVARALAVNLDSYRDIFSKNLLEKL